MEENRIDLGGCDLVEAKQREDGRDEWRTPDDVYQLICDTWEVYPEIDLFASKENTKCAAWIDKEADALKVSWMQVAALAGVKPIGWLQPPYSQPLLTEAVKKARLEAEQGFTSLFLLPAWVDQLWYHEQILEPGYKHKPWKGRIKFIPPPGIKPSSPRYGNIHGVILEAEIKRLGASGRTWTEKDTTDFNDAVFLMAQKRAKELKSMTLTWEDVI